MTIKICNLYRKCCVNTGSIMLFSHQLPVFTKLSYSFYLNIWPNIHNFNWRLNSQCFLMKQFSSIQLVRKEMSNHASTGNISRFSFPIMLEGGNSVSRRIGKIYSTIPRKCSLTWQVINHLPGFPGVISAVMNVAGNRPTTSALWSLLVNVWPQKYAAWISISLPMPIKCQDMGVSAHISKPGRFP